MLVLITYDVNTEDPAGRKRLRQIARQCTNYDQRVQNSVFECLLGYSPMQTSASKFDIDYEPEKDSMRFYYLGKHYEQKIEHFGCKPSYMPEDPLIL